MGKPPTFKIKDGPYHFSPGPAAYTLRHPIDRYDTTYEIMESARRSFNRSLSPRQVDTISKLGGSGFGSSERQPLDVKQKFNVPGPGTYQIKDKLVYPKCQNFKYASGIRKASFLEDLSKSPGPGNYKHKTVLGKDMDLVDYKYFGKNKHNDTLGMRTNSVFAMTGERNIIK